ncbi:hypothetical protein [Halorussus pelagicus]|nr:hypothetical protein [Halorussus pelagicus]
MTHRLLRTEEDSVERRQFGNSVATNRPIQAVYDGALLGCTNCCSCGPG